MGAPKGNRNALKHGLYARHLTPEAIDTLRRISPTDFQQEISIMRVLIKDLFEIHHRLYSQKKPDIEAFRMVSNSISLAVSTLHSAVKTFSLIQGQNCSQDNSILEAIRKLPIFFQDDYLSNPDLSAPPKDILTIEAKDLPSNEDKDPSSHA